MDFATGLEMKTKISCDPQMRVSRDSEYHLWYKVFQEHVDFITITLDIVSDINETFTKFFNGTPSHLLALPPYNKWTWANEKGLHILQMDYRFKMFSLGTLNPSVHEVTLKMKIYDNYCFKQLNNTEKFTAIYQKFKNTLYKNSSCSELIEDSSYLCHRCDCKASHCLANRCYKFNREHELDNSVKFCDTDMSTVTAHMYVWLIIWFIIFNYTPMLIYWLISKDDLDHSFGTHHGNKRNNEPCSYNKTATDASKKGYVPLFLICEENRRYYPFVAKIGFYLFRHDRMALKILRGALACIVLHSHVIWLFCANFIVYPFEFKERQKIMDKSLWLIEQIVVEVKGPEIIGKVLSTLSLLFAFSGLVIFCFIIIVMYGKIKRHWFYCNILFGLKLEEKFITKYITGRKGSYNYLSYNLLERRLLLFQPKFWKCVMEKVTPDVLWQARPFQKKDKSKKNSIIGTPTNSDKAQLIKSDRKQNNLMLLCFIIYIVPVISLISIVTSVILICPLLDLLLHVPWNADTDQVQDTAIKYETLNRLNDFLKGKQEGWQRGLKILKTLILAMFVVTFTVSYIYPTAKIYSLIVSYTITGVLKNYTSLLPLLMLMAFILAKIIKVCNSAAEPFVKLQLAVFEEYMSRITDEHNPIDGLIILKDSDYWIKEEFIINECKPLLCRPKIYTFIAVAKVFALIAAGVVVWICLSVLEDNTLGQILLTGFVGYLPHIFESIGKPWNYHKNKALLDKKLKERVAEKIKKEKHQIFLDFYG